MFFAPQEVFSLLENHRQNAPQEVLPKLGVDFLVSVMSSGSMKCFAPQQKGVEFKNTRGFSPKVTFSEIWRLDQLRYFIPESSLVPQKC